MNSFNIAEEWLEETIGLSALFDYRYKLKDLLDEHALLQREITEKAINSAFKDLDPEVMASDVHDGMLMVCINAVEKK